MTRVLVLGENGMLGSMVKRVLLDDRITTAGSARPSVGRSDVTFDVENNDWSSLAELLKGFTHVVNAIGIIKPRINEADSDSRVTAINVNGLFPHHLARACEDLGINVIQIATDCVYSGTSRLYDESVPHDPTDVYGKTKSLGEVPSPNVIHLRASIIGPEIGRQTSLWEWVRSQSSNAQINGFLNHLWNGVTTYHFGKICSGIIRSGNLTAGTYHLVPGDIVTKADLVTEIARASKREDIIVNRVDAKDTIDRTLSTLHREMNLQLWSQAGYQAPPTIADMVHSTPL